MDWYDEERRLEQPQQGSSNILAVRTEACADAPPGRGRRAECISREERRGDGSCASGTAAAAEEQATATADERRTAMSERAPTQQCSAAAGDRIARRHRFIVRHSPHQRRFHLAQRRKERRTSRPLAATTDGEHSARSTRSSAAVEAGCTESTVTPSASAAAAVPLCSHRLRPSCTLSRTVAHRHCRVHLHWRLLLCSLSASSLPLMQCALPSSASAGGSLLSPLLSQRLRLATLLPHLRRSPAGARSIVGLASRASLPRRAHLRPSRSVAFCGIAGAGRCMDALAVDSAKSAGRGQLICSR